MRSYPFLTENEKARQDMAYQMTLNAASQEWSDIRLAYSIAQGIKHQLPLVHQRYVDMDSIMSLSKRLSELIDDYDISVMAYEDLIKVLHEQPGVIMKVGIPSRKTPFALIDEHTRVVGVYVPKKPRLVFIEKNAHAAVQTLNDYFHTLGATFLSDMADGLKAILVSYDKYPYHIPPMRIIPRTYSLGEDIAFSRKGRQINYRITVSDEEVLLEYFLSKN